MTVSSPHEAYVELLRHHPEQVAELVAMLGAPIPSGYRQARLHPADLNQLTPTEFRADAVVVLVDERGDAVLGIIVEVQLSRKEAKRYTWPVYLTSLRHQLRCPVALMVICVDDKAAEWAAQTIELSPTGMADHRRSQVRPLVLGPREVPVVTDADQARQSPEAAVLSAIAHHDRADALRALITAISAADDAYKNLYAEVVVAALPEAAQRHLEELMTTETVEPSDNWLIRAIRKAEAQVREEFRAEGKAEGRAEGQAEGRAEGKAEGRAEGKAEGRAEGRVEGKADDVLAILEARGVDVPASARTRITECTDLDVLDRWVRRAAVAERIDDLFEER
jgi:flagellar biosynthesis/type III secretory pathway protein FliH